MSIVRDNLLTERGYTPYCGGPSCRSMPRTRFTGGQFKCASCGWQSMFDPEFIEKYKAAQEALVQDQQTRGKK